MLLQLKKEAQTLKANFDIGKEGLSEGVATELKARLKKQKLIKVRLQPGAREDIPKKELAERVAEATGSELVEVKGNTAVFYKR